MYCPRQGTPNSHSRHSLLESWLTRSKLTLSWATRPGDQSQLPLQARLPPPCSWAPSFSTLASHLGAFAVTVLCTWSDQALLLPGFSLCQEPSTQNGLHLTKCPLSILGLRALITGLKLAYSLVRDLPKKNKKWAAINQYLHSTNHSVLLKVSTWQVSVKQTCL